jgi:tetratricopeptide (TPR) repeat protein
LVAASLPSLTSSAAPRLQEVVGPSRSDPSQQAAKFVREGFDLLGQHAAIQAEAAFRQAIGAQPELAVAHRGLGQALEAEGETAAALRELKVATQLDPADADAHLALGNLAWSLRRQTAPEKSAGSADDSTAAYQSIAIKEFSAAASLRPQDIAIHLALAGVYRDAGRISESVAQASMAAAEAASARDRAEAHVALGRAYFAQGEQDKAESEFRAALDNDPDNAAALLGLGQLRLSQRRIPQAKEEFQKAIQAAPDFAPAYAALAQVLIASGQAGQAHGLLENAVKLDSSDWDSRFELAQLLMDAGQSARVIELLKDVIRLNPGFLPAQQLWGLALLRRGDLAGASAQAEKLVAANPQAAEGHWLQALVYWRKRDLDSSLAECAMVLSQNPDSAGALALEALELWQLNRKKEAREVFAQAAKADAQMGSAVIFCRVLYCDAGDIGVVNEFLRKNRPVLEPAPQP